MAWEQRARGGQYYYRSVRRNGRVVKLYLGRREAAQSFADIDAQDRRLRQRARGIALQERKDLAGIDALLRDLDRLASELVRFELTSVGCYEHKRQWRRRRGILSRRVESGDDRTQLMGINGGIAVGRPKEANDPSQVPLGTWICRAIEGDPAALKEARAGLARVPQVWEIFGLAARIESALVERAVGDNAFLKEALHREIGTSRKNLLGDASTPLERVCIERIVAASLDADFARFKAMEHSTEGGSIAMIELYDRRHTQAERRLTSAIKALATVRRLAVPNIQVNLAAAGSQQMNVQGEVQVNTEAR